MQNYQSRSDNKASGGSVVKKTIIVVAIVVVVAAGGIGVAIHFLSSAPPDDASFTLSFPVTGRNNAVNQPFTNNEEVLRITGHPSANGGTVCQDRDHGQQFRQSYVGINNISFAERFSFSCVGSYKSGKITYTETLLTDEILLVDAADTTCTLISPQINQQVTGSHTGNNTFTGTWTYGPIPIADFNCTGTGTFFYRSNRGIWMGTVPSLQI